MSHKSSIPTVIAVCSWITQKTSNVLYNNESIALLSYCFVSLSIQSEINAQVTKLQSAHLVCSALKIQENFDDLLFNLNMAVEYQSRLNSKRSSLANLQFRMFVDHFWRFSTISLLHFCISDLQFDLNTSVTSNKNLRSDKNPFKMYLNLILMHRPIVRVLRKFVFQAAIKVHFI